MKWNEIGNRIKQTRTMRQMGLVELGKLVGKHKANKKAVSHVTIRNWENGSEIKKDNWDAIKKTFIEELDTSPEWLEFGDKGKPVPEITAQKRLKDAGFTISHTTPKTIHNWMRWIRPNFVVTKSGSNLVVFVEIHQPKKLGTSINPENTREFFYIKSTDIEEIADLMQQHFLQYEKTPSNTKINTLEDKVTLKAVAKMEHLIAAIQDDTLEPTDKAILETLNKKYAQSQS